MNWAAAALAGVTSVTEGIREREGGTRGIGGGQTQTHLYTFSGLRVGGESLPVAEMKIADLPVFDMLGMGEGPAMLAGADLLESCSALISYSTGRFYVCTRP